MKHSCLHGDYCLERDERAEERGKRAKKEEVNILYFQSLSGESKKSHQRGDRRGTHHMRDVKENKNINL
jgi:hypothetical protein